ncbi:phage holin family protein [Streptomyces sp. NPDC126514]|uniref:phage holin family protein n=1 Tax=Streptomyces sp. NPDC126514 TaxID=3155210 RepID=UPI00332482F0
MERLDHLEHLDKHLVDELAQVARETIREEVREQTRRQRRTAMLYAASGTVALYAGAALALAVGLALALVLPDWAAALITAALLAVVAYVLRGAARPKHAGASPPGQALGGTAQAAPPSGTGVPYPPMPSATPPTPPVPGAPAAPVTPPRVGGTDPEQPHHRA